MIKIMKFNIMVMMKRKSFLNLVLLTPVIAFALTFSVYASEQNLFNLGNIVYNNFYFNINQNGAMNVFIVSLPIVCSLFYGDYYFYEKSFIHEILVRERRKTYYYVSNAIIAFLSGFVIVFLFLGTSFLFSFIIGNNPEHTLSYLPLGVNENDSMNQGWWLYHLFLENPYMYISIKTLCLCIYSGLLSLTTYSISLFVKAKVLAYMSTMAITLMMSFVFWIFLPKLLNWQATICFLPGKSIVKNHEFAILFWYGVFLGISSLLVFLKCRKEVLS